MLRSVKAFRQLVRSRRPPSVPPERPPGQSPRGLQAAPPSRRLERPPGQSPRGLQAAPPSRRLRPFWPEEGLWRHTDFLKLWAGQTISEFGSQFSLIALPLAAIYVLHA